MESSDAALDSNNKWKCDVCQRVYSSKGALDVHNRTHTGEKPYKCDICDKSFSQKSTLQAHIRTHTKERPYSCAYCNIKFSSLGTKNRHEQRHVKKSEKVNFACNICTNTFSRRYLLRQHTEKEHGYQAMTISCDLCDNNFNESKALFDHMQKAHPDKTKQKNGITSMIEEHSFVKIEAEDQEKEGKTSAIIKKFPCHKCTRVYSNMSHLMTHLDNHEKEKSFQCDDCGKKFLHKCLLTRHIQSHFDSKTKPHDHICKICKKTFPYADSLKHHMYLHNGYPHKCTECSKGFGKVSVLHKHMAKMHDVKIEYVAIKSVSIKQEFDS